MRESKLQKQIIDYCKLNGIYHVNIFGAGRCSKGVPDLLLCVNGYFVALECKVGNNTLQPDQILHSKWIHESDGMWGCPRSLEEAVRIIKDVQENGIIHYSK